MMMRDMQPIERYTGQIKGGLILGNNLVILIHLCGPHLPPPPPPSYCTQVVCYKPFYLLQGHIVGMDDFEPV